MHLVLLTEAAYRVGPSTRLPVGFGVIGREIFILLHNRDLIRLQVTEQSMGTCQTLKLACKYDYAVPFAFQMLGFDRLAILYSGSEQSSSQGKRLIIFYTETGQPIGELEFFWEGWDPAGREFLIISGNKYVFPHDRKIMLDRLEEDQPLLDLYDTEGHKLRSIGTAQPHPDINMASIVNRGHLAHHLDGNFFFAFDYPYRLVKFNNDGSLLWDRLIEMQFPVDTPVLSEKTPLSKDILAREKFFRRPIYKTQEKGGYILEVTYHLSRIVKDISAGPGYIAVLVSNNPSELPDRFGSRIDRFTLDGEYIDSHILDQPANFIMCESIDQLWALHEFEGKVKQYCFTGR